MRDIEELASIAVDCGLHIHKELGPGLLESVYEAVLLLALEQNGLSVQRQRPVPITFRGVTLVEAFRADLIVEDRLVIEVKSVERNAAIHSKQLPHLSSIDEAAVGLLMNFGCETFRDGVKRVVNRYEPLAPSRLRAFA